MLGSTEPFSGSKCQKVDFWPQKVLLSEKKNLKKKFRGENEFSPDFVFSVFSVVDMLSTLSIVFKKKIFFIKNFDPQKWKKKIFQKFSDLWPKKKKKIFFFEMTIKYRCRSKNNPKTPGLWFTRCARRVWVAALQSAYIASQTK